MKPCASHAPEDMYESNSGVRNSRILKKAMNELKGHPFVGGQILQVGDNKRAIYSFLTSPQESELLLRRMKDVHKQIYGRELTHETDTQPQDIENDTLEAKRHAHMITKVATAAAALATTASVTYVVLRHVRKK